MNYEEFKALAAQTSVATVTDVFDPKPNQFTILGLTPTQRDKQMFGQAVTLRSLPARADAIADANARHTDQVASGDPMMAAIKLCGPGKVLVVDSSGHPDAAIGGDTKFAAFSARGAAGLVSDGALRDQREFQEEFDFPAFVSGFTPLVGTGRVLYGNDVNIDINCGGALVVGAILGRGARWLLKIWHEEHFTLTTNITLAIAFGSFAIAESLHFSGILAVFAAALAYGYKPNPENHNKHVMAHIWDYFEYIANAVLFFLLGASFFARATWDGLSVGLVVASLALLFLSRFSALSILSPALKLDGQPLGRQTFWLLNFAGARGAVSVALILLLPDDFALKSTFLTLAFILIIFSLVAYPLAMKRLLRTP